MKNSLFVKIYFILIVLFFSSCNKKQYIGSKKIEKKKHVTGKREKENENKDTELTDEDTQYQEPSNDENTQDDEKENPEISEHTIKKFKIFRKKFPTSCKVVLEIENKRYKFSKVNMLLNKYSKGTSDNNEQKGEKNLNKLIIIINGERYFLINQLFSPEQGSDSGFIYRIQNSKKQNSKKTENYVIKLFGTKTDVQNGELISKGYGLDKNDLYAKEFLFLSECRKINEITNNIIPIQRLYFTNVDKGNKSIFIKPYLNPKNYRSIDQICKDEDEEELIAILKSALNLICVISQKRIVIDKINMSSFVKRRNENEAILISGKLNMNQNRNKDGVKTKKIFLDNLRVLRYYWPVKKETLKYKNYTGKILVILKNFYSFICDIIETDKLKVKNFFEGKTQPGYYFRKDKASKNINNDFDEKVGTKSE